ncbi:MULTISPECIES: phage distal tail protein domain-containing protein [unclassified Lactococcus]|uniref:phage distal tail protein domain-containing protein n=1 Tax=unclassified Lactococcus TaxID=2643510 RepID=UPI0011C9B106|nr:MULTISPECIES: phage distal tail protein domain-containing protein [unclassified Lactococcus]MQW22003.1 hypothetical protein [Lactococcus sp. dk101]TXK36817.1 hypothetical protein FVP42_10600 [Lactococcus sp. dk310]TXK47486.1 hypothetical protein FVP43_10245 [Lactococcus sp. dk322]
MVRQYIIHTNLDGVDDEQIDVTNGKLRFYEPNNLGYERENNIWSMAGIGVQGSSNTVLEQMTFKVETFGVGLYENYALLKEFVEKITPRKFVTLEYTTSIGTYYADLAFNNITKTEGYGFNGTFSEEITFDLLQKWYSYEVLEFDIVDNGTFDEKYSKIYATNKYAYNDIPSYTYFGESDVERFSEYEVEPNVYSFVATFKPLPDYTGNEYGIVLLDDNGTEYSAILFEFNETVPSMFEINTDVNDEYYRGNLAGTSVNLFSSMVFSRYRTRILQEGSIRLIGITDLNMYVKRRKDFV